MSDIHPSLEVRLSVLVDGQAIEHEVALLTRTVLDRVARECHLELTEENAGMFTTHLAMAIQRARRGEGLAEIPQAVSAVAAAHPMVQRYAEELTQQITAELGRPFPSEETAYITLYLTMLTQGGDEAHA